jgi:tetratricopeptide (TPR) repeat protein
MPLEPKHPSRSDRPAAERQFVDREELIAPVHAALKEPQRTKPLVLVYYGGAGIGKSRLRRELTKQMASEPGVLTATLDFTIPIYRQPDTALFFLRKTIHEVYQVRFPSFDIACSVLWQKTHTEASLGDDLKPLLEPGSLLAQLLDDSGKLPLIGLVPRISSLLVRSPEPQNPRPPEPSLRAWWSERGERELEDLPQMEPAAIVEQLPKLWAADLKDYLQAGSPESRVQSPEVRLRSAVLFIDSYEKLWETGSTEAEFFKRDEWVRELVKQLPEALWVICGRQKLRWEEVEADWGESLGQHQLGALPDKSARRFLESCGITNEPIQDAIVKGSQGVPHYLDLAVDTIQSSEFGVRSSELQGDSPAELVKQFVRHLNQPEIETLQVLSGPRFWYYGLFENLMTEYQTGYPLTAYDDLSRFSFVKEGAAPGTRTMHELMREALQESQSPELRKRVHLFLHELYAKQLEGLDVKSITDQQRAALTEAFYHGRQAKSAEELWSWFEDAHDVFEDAGQCGRLLIPLFREMVEALETELGPNHADAADALHHLAWNLEDFGECDEAELLMRRAVTILEKGHGPEHPLVLGCLPDLGQLLKNRARYDEAEVLYRRAVGVYEREPGSYGTNGLFALMGLAQVLERKGQYAEAEELFRRALATAEEDPGPDSRPYVVVLQDLAGTLHDQRRNTEAELLFRRALAIAEKVLGANHKSVASSSGGLAEVLEDLGRYAESVPLRRRALKLREETLGPDRPETAVSMNNLGTVLGKQGRHAEAEALHRRALAVHEKKMGPDHYRTVLMARNLVSVLVRQGKYAEAEPMALSALANREKKLGPDHPETATALHWVGVMCGDQGRYAEAESYLRRALDIRTRVLGPEHPDTLESLDSLGILKDRRGRSAEAESLYRDVLEKRERVQGPEHPDVADAATRLAGICGRDGRYAEAEALYRRALVIREKVFGPDHPFVADVLDGLAKVCEQTGRTSEAQELSERAKRIRAQAEPAPAPDNPK